MLWCIFCSLGHCSLENFWVLPNFLLVLWGLFKFTSPWETQDPVILAMPWFLPGFPSPWPPASLRYCSLLLGLLLPSWWSSHCSLLPSSNHLPLWHQRDHVTLPPIPTPFKAFLRLLLILQRKSSLSKMASKPASFDPLPFSLALELGSFCSSP